ncbi:WD40-repeat-containing domain protein [Parasitella parasitica]|nr:WD40-repeat-containing domain protein [Parasitella parasitica]
MKPEKSEQTDEGYVEQRFEEPLFMKDWSDDRKAEFAYQILLCIPVSKIVKVVGRLSPLLHRDFTATLPHEIAIQILHHLDLTSLTCMMRVNKRWKLICEDQTLWRSLFYASGWSANKSSIQHYLSSPSVPESVQTIPQKTVSSIPLARTTANLYDPTALPTMPGAPLTRLKPFKRSTDLFLDKVLRYSIVSSSNYDLGWSSGRHIVYDASSSASSSVNNSACTSASTSTSTNSNSSSSASLAIRPTHVYPSRSQPLLARSPTNTNREALSHVIIERPFVNRPFPRLHVKYDEAAVFHYQEQQDVRFINWKRLYRNRRLVDQRWKEGKCKIRPFPPKNNFSSAPVFEDVQHNSGIYCLQFDSNLLVTGSRDRNLKMWNIRTGQLLRTLEGHTASVLCLQFDHRYIISGSSDGTLIIWDINTGRKLKTLKGHGESVLNVKLLGNTIVSCSKDRTVRTWDLDRGVSKMTFRGHRAAVNAVQFKGDRIVSASGDRAIKIWDMNTGQCLKTLDSHSRGIACVEYDGQYIVSGSSDQSIKVWDAITGECLRTLLGHTDLVRTLQLDSKSKTIVSGSYDGCLKIWDLEQGKEIKTLDQSSHGRILNLQFDFSKIVCCSNLGKIDMYDFTHAMDTQFLL